MAVYVVIVVAYIILAELPNQHTEISILISRRKGLFRRVSVFWEVQGSSERWNASAQLNPTSGVVDIVENLNSATISLKVLNDQVMHKDLSFYSSSFLLCVIISALLSSLLIVLVSFVESPNIFSHDKQSV